MKARASGKTAGGTMYALTLATLLRGLDRVRMPL